VHTVILSSRPKRNRTQATLSHCHLDRSATERKRRSASGETPILFPALPAFSTATLSHCHLDRRATERSEGARAERPLSPFPLCQPLVQRRSRTVISTEARPSAAKERERRDLPGLPHPCRSRFFERQGGDYNLLPSRSVINTSCLYFSQPAQRGAPFEPGRWIARASQPVGENWYTRGRQARVVNECTPDFECRTDSRSTGLCHSWYWSQTYLRPGSPLRYCSQRDCYSLLGG